MFRNESAELPICPPEPFADNVVKVYVIAPAENGTGTLAERVERYEKSVVQSELDKHSYRMTETARVLGLERSHLKDPGQNFRSAVKKQQ